MKVPKPRDGWRVFAGEVGVIVLGVLLALGAQQVVETVQVRSDIREFRRTIDREIGMTVFTYVRVDYRTLRASWATPELNIAPG